MKRTVTIDQSTLTLTVPIKRAAHEKRYAFTGRLSTSEQVRTAQASVTFAEAVKAKGEETKTGTKRGHSTFNEKWNVLIH